MQSCNIFFLNKICLKNNCVKHLSFNDKYTFVTQQELMRLFEGDIKTDILNF